MRSMSRTRLLAAGSAALAVALAAGALAVLVARARADVEPGPATLAPRPLPPGSATGGGGFPGDTVVARLAVDPEALAGVSTSGELVAALREHLTVDAALPFDEPLTVSLRGYAGDRDGSAPGFHFVYCGLSLRHRGADPLEGASYAAALRESHPDDELCMDEETWDEEAEWARLVEALEIGLPQSSDSFDPPPAAGELALRVTGVHVMDGGDWELMESLNGPLLELQPQPDFPSLRSADWEEPEGFGYDVRLLVILLEPRSGPR